MARAAAVFAISAVVWLAYFYAIDLLIMEAQGLPVSWTLMPES